VRFLFATWDGGGNVPPTLSLARKLIRRGHSVTALGPSWLRPRFETAGCAFSAYEHVPKGAPSAGGTTGIGRARAALLVPELARAAPALAFAEDVLSELERAPADALVIDFMLAGAIAAAERAELPTAALMHTVYCLPAAGKPPFGPGFQARAGLVGRLRDTAVTALARRTSNNALTDLNRARRQIGLAPVGAAANQLARVSRVLVLTSRAFDPPPAALPPNIRYVGPQLDDSWSEPSDRSWLTHDRDPLVVVSFSTRFAAPRIAQRVIDALSTLHVRGLLTLGPALRAQDLRVPANILVRSFVPHHLVFPHVKLVITHAGLGTIMTALAYSVPLICIPLKNDQFENAARVAAAGAGQSVNRNGTRRSLQQTILQILDEPRFRDDARRMADAINADCASAVDELEALAAPADVASRIRSADGDPHHALLIPAVHPFVVPEHHAPTEHLSRVQARRRRASLDGSVAIRLWRPPPTLLSPNSIAAGDQRGFRLRRGSRALASAAPPARGRA
jgi:MGT family glycosyltransferase